MLSTVFYPTSMAYLKIATFNCAGLTSSTRRRTIFEHLRSLDIQIYCLQETHSTTGDESKWAREWGQKRACFLSNHRNDRTNGVAFLLNHPNLDFITWHGDQNGRVITADFNTSTTTIHIVNIYAPQCGRPVRERALFFDSIYLYLFSPHPTILTGDFNCVENPTLDRDPPTDRKDHTSSLRVLRETFGLRDTFRIIHGNTRLFTRRQGLSQSRIDRFYACGKITPLSEQTLPGLASDHDMVVIEVNTTTTPRHGKGQWMNNVASYSDPMFKTWLQYKWNQWRTLQPYFFETKAEWWLKTKIRVKHLLIDHAKARRASERCREAKLRSDVETLCREVDNHPSLLPMYFQSKTRWCEFQKEQANAKAKKSRLNNFENNDRGTKEFFLQFKRHREQTSIIRLQSPEGKPLISKQDILTETQRFFQSLYRCRPTRPEAQSAFFHHINQVLDPLDDELTRPFTAEEIRTTIQQAKSGKSPGPDGITIEFYKLNWSIIAQDLTDVFNEIQATAHIPSEMIRGNIILIHKKNTTELLQNYRPISLLNTDLKLYTKLLANRMKNSLSKVISAQQYARPGSQIFHVLTLLRDMYQHSSSRGYEHFYLSLDFEKAFDSIDHSWLFQVLRRYGFAPKFVNIITALYTRASSEVTVNGFRTRPFTIERGVRQNDPLSLFLFLIAAEPLMAAIRHNNDIIGIKTPGRVEVKALCYADDTTMTVSNETSVRKVFSTLQLLEYASGLKLNYAKTSGLCTSDTCDVNFMPKILWKKEAIHILGSVIGAHGSVASLWDRCIRNLTATAKYFSTFFLTWSAKSLIVKSKLLPLATYTASIYPPPPKVRRNINNIIERFIAGHRDITISIDILARPLRFGGYNVPDIGLYCDLFLLRPIFDYVKHRKDFTPATAQLAMVEYHIGHQLSTILDLPLRNSIPHIARPSVFYSHALALVKKYKLNSEQLYEHSIHQIYHRLISNACPVYAASPKWRAIHNDVLSNSLKTFNYRAIYETLPLATKQYTAYLDPRSACRFCQHFPEQSQHIFFTCTHIQPVWNFIKNTISKLDNAATFNLDYSTITQFNIPTQLHHVKDHIIYLFSVTRQKIWNHRNNIEQNKMAFSAKKIIQSISRSANHRLHLERHSTLKKHVRIFEEIRAALTHNSSAT